MAGIGRRGVLGMAVPVLGITLGGAFLSRARAQGAPGDYPAGYGEIVRDAMREGRLLIYCNVSANNWRHVLAGFRARYPGIAVEMLDLGSRESTERYLAEKATGVSTADLIVTASQPGWMDLHRRGEILGYASPESAAWPEWSRPMPGLYTVSTDPLTFLWNTALVRQLPRPKTFAAFAQLCAENKGSWRNKVSSYNPVDSPFGFVAHTAMIRHHGERAWPWLEAVAALPPRFESTGGPLIEKATNGEYAAVYFMSAIQVWPRMEDPVRGRLLAWNFIEDGQPMMMRGIGIPKASRNVNAAKLMLDYILSAEGQVGFGQGGLTPARPGVQPSNGVAHTYSSIADAVGQQNLMMVDYDPALLDESNVLSNRLKAVFRGR